MDSGSGSVTCSVVYGCVVVDCVWSVCDGARRSTRGVGVV